MAVTSDGTPYVEPGDAISAYPVVSQELAAVIDSLRTMIPPGAIFPYAGKTAPEGYLMCDGKAYNRADFFDLYNVMAEWVGQWGGFPNGNSAHFFVPDFRGRVPVGTSGTTGGDAANNPVRPTDLGQRLGSQWLPLHWHRTNFPDTDAVNPAAVPYAVTGGGFTVQGSGTGWSSAFMAIGGVFDKEPRSPDNDRVTNPATGVNFIVWTGTTTAGKNPVPGVELAPITTRMMIEARLEEAGIGEEEIEMLREQLAALKEDTDG